MRYVIGDIHGCVKTFREMVGKVIRLTPSDTLFLLGDYIDRGPDSKGVIDYILDLGKSSFDIRPIMGNHEYMLLQSLESKAYAAMWSLNGNVATFLSYGASQSAAYNPGSIRKIPVVHLNFFRSLPFYREEDDFLVVHAGIEQFHPDPLKDPDILLWTRSEGFSEEVLKGRKLVHGHTPVSFESIKERLSDPGTRVINLDGGCVYRHIPGLGKLVAMNLDTLELYSCDYLG